MKFRAKPGRDLDLNRNAHVQAHFSMLPAGYYQASSVAEVISTVNMEVPSAADVQHMTWPVLVTPCGRKSWDLVATMKNLPVSDLRNSCGGCPVLALRNRGGPILKAQFHDALEAICWFRIPKTPSTG